MRRADRFRPWMAPGPKENLYADPTPSAQPRRDGIQTCSRVDRPRMCPRRSDQRSLLSARLTVDGTWPMRTELAANLKKRQRSRFLYCTCLPPSRCFSADQHLQSLFARVAPRDARGADRDWACRGRADGHTAGCDRRPRSVCCTLLHCTLIINDMLMRITGAGRGVNSAGSSIAYAASKAALIHLTSRRRIKNPIITRQRSRSRCSCQPGRG